MMRMEHRLVQNQSQRLMLTQKMQQAIQILQLSGMELEQYVQQELETNVALEQVASDKEPETKPQEDPKSVNDAEPFEDGNFDLDNYLDSWAGNKGGRDLSVNPGADDRRQYYEDSITKEESFVSRLLSQLRFAVKDPQRYAIGERIVGDIDDRGYFTGSLEEIAQEMNAPLPEVERLLYTIQKFEPTGVGARDVVECLLLQINVEFPDEQELKVLVAEHLEDLERRQIPKIAKAMGVSTERVEQLKVLLSGLDPWPGHEYAFSPPQYVTPDVIVEKIDGQWEIYLNDGSVPDLRISRDYRDLMKNGRIGKDEKKYLRDKVESARWLIRNIEQRQQTILRISKAIMEVQEAFLEKGVSKIKPLTLQEIADVVGVHEATVSRTTRGKYVQTPQGLFELKYFFSPGLKSDTGEQSSKSVQSMIKKIIEDEDKVKPLSDQKIANLLKAQGISIARRTVTKYREALGILPTNLRRMYGE